MFCFGGNAEKRENDGDGVCGVCVFVALFYWSGSLTNPGKSLSSDHVSFTSAFPRLVEYLHLPGQYSVNDG